MAMEHLDQKVKEHQEVLLKYPKNIRQIGEIGEGKRIYLEDYVMTYATHLAGMAKEGYASAVLLGQKAVVEGRRTLFISGAVELVQNWQQPSVITGEQWTAVYDQIQKYFHHVEILGWFLTHPGMELEADEKIRSVWHSGFEGEDRILFLYDNISREEVFYTYREGEFLRQPGYYIYYEKNEQMQNYMIDRKGGKSTDEGYQDTASGKIRKKIEKKNQEHKQYLFQQQLAYSAGILAGAVVLVVAATRLYGSTSEEASADFAESRQVISKDGTWLLSKEGKEEKQEKKDEKKESIQEIKTAEKEAVDGEDIPKEQEPENTEENGEEPETAGEQENNGAEEEQKTEEGNLTGKKEENQEKKTEEAGTGEETKQENQKKTEQETASSGVLKKRYKVKKGDTLESISIACYGTSRYIKKIKKMNQLEDADKIYIGQELILP